MLHPAGRTPRCSRETPTRKSTFSRTCAAQSIRSPAPDGARPNPVKWKELPVLGPNAWSRNDRHSDHHDPLDHRRTPTRRRHQAIMLPSADVSGERLVHLTPLTKRFLRHSGMYSCHNFVGLGGSGHRSRSNVRSAFHVVHRCLRRSNFEAYQSLSVVLERLDLYDGRWSVSQLTLFRRAGEAWGVESCPTAL
jgi:hypothetical protein